MYSFSGLKQKSIDDINEKLDVFERSEILMSKDFECIDDTIDSLSLCLVDKSFIVLHERIITVGKKRIFKGHAAVAEREDILFFMEKMIGDDDFRPLRILPKDNDRYLVYVSDDGFCVFGNANLREQNP